MVDWGRVDGCRGARTFWGVVGRSSPGFEVITAERPLDGAEGRVDASRIGTVESPWIVTRPYM